MINEPILTCSPSHPLTIWFSYNYRIAVVEEGVFDRGEVAHAINLFDMNAKYADVITTEAAVSYLSSANEAPGE